MVSHVSSTPHHSEKRPKKRYEHDKGYDPNKSFTRAASLSCVFECKTQTHEALTSDKFQIENESGIIELDPAASPTSS